MIEQEILQALQQATTDAVVASGRPTLPVKYVDRTGFVIPNDHTWLEIIHIPNNIIGQYWGNEKTYRGIFRLILHWGNSDVGAYPPLTLAAAVAAHFGKGRTFTIGQIRVKITEQPDLTGVIEGAPESLYPVSIRYSSFQH